MGRNGRKRTGAKLDLNIVNDLVELLSVDITLDRGAHQTDQKLIAVEPLLSSV